MPRQGATSQGQEMAVRRYFVSLIALLPQGEEGDERHKQQQICHKDNYNGKLWGQRRVWGRGMGGSSTPEVSRSTADLREKGPEVESCLQAVEIDIFALNHKQQ